ncbi:MAG: iron dependent repressor, metal binding and dimerization domain protein [Eubacteriales bacterium]|nr:iron dependent repressor, metal binding and dimerization domain protein [Eubacteriales bacterium]
MDINSKEFYTVRGYHLLEQNKRLITPAMEDYLEMIYRCGLQERYVRINRLSQLLNVKASSASKMVQKLGSLGLMKYEKYGVLVLSDKGKEIGKFLLERHNIIEKFLRLLGCSEDNILKQTELIEHNLNTETIHRLEILNNFFTSNPTIAGQFGDFEKK